MNETVKYQLWAANLLRLSALLMAVAYFIPPMNTRFELTMVAVLINMIIAIILAYFIRKGYRGPKWILLALMAINMPFFVIGFLQLFGHDIRGALLSALINIVQLIALLLLFIPVRKDAATGILEETE